MRTISSFVVGTLFLAIISPGCCGLFQPTEASVKHWANREITIGMSREDALRIIARHGLTSDDDGNGRIVATVLTGKCLADPTGYAVTVVLWFDDRKRVKEFHVATAHIINDSI